MDDDDLTPAQLEHFRTLLVNLVEELESHLNATEDGAKPVDLDEPIGRLSRMEAMQQQSMAKANRQRAEIRLRQVRAALANIDEGDYGFCNKCEEPIPVKRLEVYPESPLCLECQSALEGRKRRRR